MIIATIDNTVKIRPSRSIFNLTYRRYSGGDIEYNFFKEYQVIGRNGGRKKLTDINKNQQVKTALYREQARIRAGSTVRRLVKANNLYIMWSLTYAAEVIDREKALYDFKKFMLRLNYQLGEKIPYVAVIEVQRKREAKTGKPVLHFHMAIDRYIAKKQLQEIWGHGNVFFTNFKDSKERISGTVESVAGYMSKYLKKDMQDNPEMAGRKMYLNSKGLKRPNKGHGIITADEAKDIQNSSEYTREIKDGVTFGILNAKKLINVANIPG